MFGRLYLIDFFFFQAEDGIRDKLVTGVQTCALPISITAGFVALLAQLPAMEGFDTPRIVPFSAVVAIVSLALAGIGAGVYPARQAALLEPVEALRQE